MRKRNVKKAVKILRDARELVEAGWVKGTLIQYPSQVDEPVAYCSLGALNKAYTGNAEVHASDYARTKWFSHHAAYEVAYHALQENVSYYVQHGTLRGLKSITYFNDYYLTSKNDVLEAFDKAIDDLESVK